MTVLEINNWQDIQAVVLGRINSREWKPGDLIPKESDLAIEFGCARATVNRALREVAEAGFLDRRRKAGTRVATNPVRKATLLIPIIRQEIEGRNQSYSYTLIQQTTAKPPLDIRAKMGFKSTQKALHIEAVHFADKRPYVFEDRWINIDGVPEAIEIDFEVSNANEWLVQNAPFTRGDFAFSSVNADPKTAEILGARINEGLFVVKRTTWNDVDPITVVKLIYHPGYEMRTEI